MQAEGDVDCAVAGDGLEVLDGGALQLGGSRGFTNIDPADSLVSIDEVHCHGLLVGDGGQPECGATQGGAADVMEVSDQQHRQAIHWLWGGSLGQWIGGEGIKKKKIY